MFNLKNLVYEKKGKKSTQYIAIDFEEIIKFYYVLVKYRNRHPCFDLKRIILKLYPNINWDDFFSKMRH